jgi:cytochrome c-type biogenesis protein CcmE
MKTRTKLMIGVCMIAAATAYMGYGGASASWKYYLTSDECVANAAELVGSRMRVSGKVAADSLQRAVDSGEVTFSFAGTSGQLKVVAFEPLPDNFAEGMDVVVEGRLEKPDLFRGDKVLTRCASKYKSETAAASDGPAAGTARKKD